MANLLLASASPRRKELLDQIGVHYESASMDIDETVHIDETPSDYVMRMAKEKALAGLAYQSNMVVLAADTTVVIHGHILGKPENTEAAKSMLKQLSGATHQVFTAIAVARSDQGKVTIESSLVLTDVTLSVLSNDQIQKYVATGEPMDKAGAYGIQGKAALFIENIKGSYSNVVGLPLAETGRLLQAFDIAVW